MLKRLARRMKSLSSNQISFILFLKELVVGNYYNQEPLDLTIISLMMFHLGCGHFPTAIVT